MLPKNFRLPSAEFRKVKKFGRSAPGKFFLVSYWVSDSRSRGAPAGQTPGVLVRKHGVSGIFPRFGFVVTKSLDKRAVVRNRIRRRLSESVRLFVKDRGRTIRATPGVQIPDLTGKDPGSRSSVEICFIAYKSILGKSYAQISFEVRKALSKILEL